MDLVFGQRYERLPGEDPEKFIGALADFMKGRLGGLPLELELVDGAIVAGSIDAISSSSVKLERSDGSLVGTFAGSDIAAFVLVDEVLDRSDELRPAE